MARPKTALPTGTYVFLPTLARSLRLRDAATLPVGCPLVLLDLRTQFSQLPCVQLTNLVRQFGVGLFQTCLEVVMKERWGSDSDGVAEFEDDFPLVTVDAQCRHEIPPYRRGYAGAPS